MNRRGVPTPIDMVLLIDGEAEGSLSDACLQQLGKKDVDGRDERARP